MGFVVRLFDMIFSCFLSVIDLARKNFTRSYISYVIQNETEKKPYGPFLWMGFNCLTATEPLQGDDLTFTTNYPGVSGTQFNDLRRMKSWVDLGATQYLWGWGIQRPNHKTIAPYPLGLSSLENVGMLFKNIKSQYLIHAKIYQNNAKMSLIISDRFATIFYISMRHVSIPIKDTINPLQLFVEKRQFFNHRQSIVVLNSIIYLSVRLCIHY